MEQASTTFGVDINLVLSTQGGVGSGLETAVGRRHSVDDDDGAARGSTPPNDVDFTRISYQQKTELLYLNVACSFADAYEH